MAWRDSDPPLSLMYTRADPPSLRVPHHEIPLSGILVAHAHHLYGVLRRVRVRGWALGDCCDEV